MESRTTWKKSPFSVKEGMDEPEDTPEVDLPEVYQKVDLPEVYQKVDLPEVIADMMNANRLRREAENAKNKQNTNSDDDANKGSSPDYLEYVFISPIVSKTEPVGMNAADGKEDPISNKPREAIAQANQRATTNTHSILDLPKPVGRPKLKRPKRDGFTSMKEDTIREGMSDLFSGEQKMKDIGEMWKSLTDKENRKTLFPRLIQALKETFASIPKLFYLPEMLSLKIVDLFYTDGNNNRENPDYLNDASMVEKHLKHYVAVIFGLWAAFNWWYLLFYTDHYIDLTSFIEAKMFNPVSWIIGPATSAAVVLNYYLLGKRMEESFYDKYVRPILDHKWFTMTLFFIVFSAVYPPLNKYFGETIEDIKNKEPNQLASFIMFFGCFSYLYKIVFDFNKMKAVQGLFKSMLLTIVIFIILMVFVMIATKISTMLIIMYLTFYSTVPLLYFPFMDGSNPITQIIRMINDTRESCGKANPAEGVFTHIKKFFKRNFFLLYVGSIYLAVMIEAMVELDNMKSSGLKGLSHFSYAMFIVIPIIIALLHPKAASVVNIVTSTLKPADPEAPEEPEVATSVKFLAFFAIFLEGIITLPFLILASIFQFLLRWINEDLANNVYNMFMIIPLTLWSILKSNIIPKQYIITPTDEVLDSTQPQTEGISTQYINPMFPNKLD